MQSSIYKTVFYIDISGECNWGCDYCNAPVKNTTGNIKNALSISKLMTLRGMDFTNSVFIITGGEPSIYGIEYNKNIIRALKNISPTTKIEYMSNLSATEDFYKGLSVDSYIFSYHVSGLSVLDFMNKASIIREHTDVQIRVSTNDRSLFQISGVDDESILWFSINDIDADNIGVGIVASDIFEVTPGGMRKIQ